MDESKEKQFIVTTTMSKAYQITVPSVVRKALGLMPGDPVDFKQVDDQIILVKALTREEKIKQVFARLEQIRAEENSSMTPEQRAFAKKSAGWTANQHRDYIANSPKRKSYIKEKYGS